MVMPLVNTEVKQVVGLQCSHGTDKNNRSKVVDMRPQHHKLRYTSLRNVRMVVYPLHPHRAFLTLTHTEYNSRNSHSFHVRTAFH